MSLGSRECWRTPPSHQSHHHLTGPAPERQHQIRTSTLKPASLEYNVDTKCWFSLTTKPLLSSLTHYTLRGVSMEPQVYTTYWTLKVRAEQGSVLIGKIWDSDGKISISVLASCFSTPYGGCCCHVSQVHIQAKPKGKKLRISSTVYMKDLRSYQCFS